MTHVRPATANFECAFRLSGDIRQIFLEEIVLRQLLVTALASVLLCSAYSATASAQTVDAKTAPLLWQELQAGNLESEQALQGLIVALAEQRQNTIDFLATRLAVAKDDEERLDITYVTAITLTHGKGALTLPPDMEATLVALLMVTDNTALQANIVNVATNVGEARAKQFIAPLLTVLSKTSDPGLQASTQYALGSMGEQVLPALYDEIRRSQDEKLIGNIAIILKGQKIPADVIDILRTNVNSKNTETRAQILIVLQGAGVEGQDLIAAAVENLRKSDTDMARMTAVFKLHELSPPREVLIPALTDALATFNPASTSSERVQVARILTLTGDEGLQALAGATRKAATTAAKYDLLQIQVISAKNDPVIIDSLLDIALQGENEEVTGRAIRGLVRIGKPTLPAIDAGILAAPSEAVGKQLRTARSMILMAK